MKVLLMSMNSKFIHSNLSVYYLKRYAEKFRDTHPEVSVTLKEYTINMNLDDVLSSVISGQYDVVFASAYIWNVEMYSVLFHNLREVCPTVSIVYGGPEVTYNPVEQLESHAYLDAVLVGEGEETFLACLKQFSQTGKADFNGIEGVVYKSEGHIIQNPLRRPMHNLDDIPFPYEAIDALENKIIYYETTRGCPYNCSYCLSSAIKGVRYFGHEKVFNELKIFLDAKVPQVKFVDRTFNVNKKHAIPILEYLVAHDNGTTNFHFEVNADLLDEDYLEVISRSRKGLFQFEIGVQSTCEAALNAINRPIPFEKVKANTQKLIALDKAHTHVDLIAGLPYESYERFLQSFDEVFSIGADHVQMGFLKLLKGTSLHNQSAIHGYKIRVQTPYEVLENQYISYSELNRLKKIEALLEHYINSEKFFYSMQYLVKTAGMKMSTLLEQMSLFWDKHHYFETAMSTFRLYEVLNDFSQSLGLDESLFNDLLKVDFYKTKQKGIKALFYYEEDEKFNSKRLLLLNDSDFIGSHLPQYRLEKPKQILKSVAFVSVRFNIETLVKSDYTVIDKVPHVLIVDQDADDPYHSLVQVPMKLWEEI